MVLILFRTDEIFIKLGELIPESTQDTTAVALPTKPTVIPLQLYKLKFKI